MDLDEILRDVLENLHGVQLAGIVGTDGLGVEMAVADGASVQRDAVEIELGELAAVASQAASRLNAGQMRDLILEAEGRTFLATSITPGYYAVLGVNTNGNLGRARFALRQMAEHQAADKTGLEVLEIGLPEAHKPAAE